MGMICPTWKVPSPLPSRIVMVSLFTLPTARSGTPSPLKSPPTTRSAWPWELIAFNVEADAAKSVVSV
jgi:hypothetical protein